MIEQANRPTGKFEPAAEFVIEDLETLKVLADPLRMRILELFHKPRTVKQIAAELDMPATKLYYHVNQLEQRGLIRMVDTRIVSGIIEKHYQVAAKSYNVKKGLISPDPTNIEAGLEISLDPILNNARAEIIESTRAGVLDPTDEREHLSLDIFQGMMRLSPDQMKAFKKRLDDLLSEFKQLCNQPEGKHEQAYRLIYFMYPTSRHAPDPDDEA